jgi:ABC-type phosphate transport system substrate-binding protein
MLLIIPVANSQQPAVHLVVNTSVKADEITKTQARRIFSMRQATWPNDSPITVYVMDDRNQIHNIFSTQVLGLFPYQLDRIWNKLVYSGLGEEPIKVKSEQEMLEKISKNPGSIGYVTPNKKIDIVNVKIVQVVKE